MTTALHLPLLHSCLLLSPCSTPLLTLLPPSLLNLAGDQAWWGAHGAVKSQGKK